jgi:hypothetical protein
VYKVTVFFYYYFLHDARNSHDSEKCSRFVYYYPSRDIYTDAVVDNKYNRSPFTRRPLQMFIENEI